jgi:hypothetical protein
VALVGPKLLVSGGGSTPPPVVSVHTNGTTGTTVAGTATPVAGTHGDSNKNPFAPLAGAGGSSAAGGTVVSASAPPPTTAPPVVVPTANTAPPATTPTTTRSSTTTTTQPTTTTTTTPGGGQVQFVLLEVYTDGNDQAAAIVRVDDDVFKVNVDQAFDTVFQATAIDRHTSCASFTMQQDQGTRNLYLCAGYEILL